MPGARTDLLVETIGEAMQLPSQEREAYVQRACPEPADRAEALSLLRALERAGPFMGRAGQTLAAPPGEQPGTLIDRYRLIERIGEGGFGVVFKAEQLEPVRRTVALKIIKLGMDTGVVIARFEAERQALALMDHPGIAKVFDGGATESGRPYFVMELVDGEPITRYCARRSLSLRPRLELFVQVCRAVQHAHTKGIIHRDLKPANVLVSELDGRALPRIIDFGIAKATGAGFDHRTVLTDGRLFMGTPEYMSPEQAQSPGVDTDTRTDIYSLGVLLYELLTGVTPLDGAALRSAAWDQMMRMIRDEDPPKPSTRVARNPPSPRASADARTSHSGLRGDLDWIVMCCLEKDRERRYQSAESLAADLQRHLSGQAVLAAPPSRFYRLRKAASRHRIPVAAGLLVLLSLVGGLGAAVWQARVAARERDAAESRRRETEAVAGFQADQLREIDPHAMAAHLFDDLVDGQRTALAREGLGEPEIQARRDQLTALLRDINLTDVSLQALDRNIFSRAIGAIDQKFQDQPAVRAGLLLTAGATMAQLGLLDAAEAPLRRSLDLRRELFGDENPATIRASAEVAALALRRGRLDEADRLLAETLDRARKSVGPDDPLTIDLIVNTGGVRRDQDRFADAERLFRDALERSERTLGPDDERTLRALENLAVVLPSLRKLDEAEAILRRALAGFTKLRGPDAPETTKTLNNLANCLRLQGKTDQAEPLLRESVRKLRQHNGDMHPDTLNACAALGLMLFHRGTPPDLAESETYLREAFEGRKKSLGPTNKDTLQAEALLARVCAVQGRGAEAEPLFREALAGLEASGAGSSPVAFIARMDLARCLTNLSRFPEAERLLLDTSKALGRGHGGAGAGRGPQGQDPCAADLVNLYTAWDRAEPGQGYGAKAAHWQTNSSGANSGPSPNDPG